MKRFFALSAIVCSLTMLAGEADFPSFESLKAPVLMPENPKISIARDGNFLINGEPRYLIGTHYYDGMNAGYAPTPGYPESLKWLYDAPLDYKNAQRIGFDTLGVHASDTWIKKLNPAYRSFLWGKGEEEALQSLLKVCGEPVYLDYSCFPWTHGVLANDKNAKLISPDAKNHLSGGKNDGNHWMAYSANSPEGRSLYFDMWRSGAEFMVKNGVHPFIYELFNEPDYNDWSPYNRKLFVERLQKQYKSIDELNSLWHSSYKSFQEICDFSRQTENPALHVEWAKFMEDSFVQLCSDGIKVIKEVDNNPDVGFCVQPMIFKGTNVNSYKLSKIMNRISSSTGGGSLLQSHFLRSIADGKPISDGETYTRSSYNTFRDAFWTQYARGFNASYIFKWDKRAWDKDWGKNEKTPEGGKKVAEIFQYLILNPYAVPTESITGIMGAKKEIMAVSDLFTPRDRGIKHEIAVLRSYPTERVSPAKGALNHNFIDDYSLALDYSHFAIDVIMEEQFAEGRQDRYKVIVAAGVDAVYPETPAYLEAFVKKGGTLILGLEALQNDEYAFARKNNKFPIIVPGKELAPEISTLKSSWTELKDLKAAPYKEFKADSSWTVLASINDSPVIYSKKLDKGQIIYINAKMPVDSLGRVLTSILTDSALLPFCRTIDAMKGVPASDIEIHPAKRGGFSGFVFFNRSLAPKLVKFSADFMGNAVCNPFDGKLLEKKDGEVMLFLPPSERLVLIGGEEKQLLARFGALKKESFSESEKNGKEKLEIFRKDAEKKTAGRFKVDPASVKMLDLKKFANRAFVDGVPGDGKGGWTDQGENSLHGMGWGVIDCEGVPFDIIRYDHNEDRTCIVMKSKNMKEGLPAVNGIAVEAQVNALYFLHATAWTDKSEAMKYIVHYADGTTVEIPIRCGLEVGDWFYPMQKVPGMKAVGVKMNSQNRGLFVFEWKNPQPEKTISSLDVVSSCGEAIPIVVSISALLQDSAASVINLPELAPAAYTPFAWGGANASFEDGLKIGLDDKSTDWCGVNLKFRNVFKIPAGIKEKGRIEFLINGNDDAWGKNHGRIGMQIRLDAFGQNKSALSSGYINISQYIDGAALDEDSASWQKVSMPLARLLNSDDGVIDAIHFQFTVLPAQKSGVTIKDLKLRAE